MKTILLLLAFCVQMSLTLGHLWFTGLDPERTEITPLRFGNGANYVYKYSDGNFLKISCESNATCDEKDFKVFNASSGKVTQLNTTFEGNHKLDGSSLFCSCENLRNKTYHSIMLELKSDKVARPFFTGLNSERHKGEQYYYKEGEFLNIGCETEIPVETKRFMFYNLTLDRYRHLFHSRFQAVGDESLLGSRLHCVYENPEGAYIQIKIRFQNFKKISFAQLGRKMKTKKTDAAAVLTEKWTKVVKVEMHGEKDASIMPIISIEKVQYTEFSGTKASCVSTEYILPIDTKWELPRESLSFGDILGEGEFGRVLKAEYVRTADSRLPGVVAVKMLKEEHSDSDMTALVSEMEIMKMIGKHENVVNLLGCCTQDGPLCVVVEYASNGCLREFLNKHNPKCSPGGVSQLNERVLVQFALQVAKGMEFLVSRGCIHRDLAARNVLVSGDLTIKIADFGLARDVRDYAYYRKRSAGRLPVRWMAPESLENNYYTEHSDV
ncbi:fibroblast growth factor receptor homolog 1-like [Choristoneura fumiferana]|uniref:fibroblast growth factor receptor homolog 1-like n=1 Tax=Choristoneura fumiferana TaxID=7141 RepID=UPI003D15CACF